MTTVSTTTTTTTYTLPAQVDEKYPAVFHHEFRLEQRTDPSYTTTTSATSTPATPHQSSQTPEIRPLSPKTTQSALLLHGVGEQYTLVTDHAIPAISKPEEILVKIQAIGLNPVDWKGPAYNFGLPTLPWINGRDLAGIVVQTNTHDKNSRIRVGDRVLVPSTDYRDIRKAAFQQYAVATHFNAARIPESVCLQESASLGVAFVASVLALGVSLGLDFSGAQRCPGPNLVETVLGLDVEGIPVDIREQCLAAVPREERLRGGEWIAIWGASTTTGYITLQLAKLAGLTVICVADIARHGSRLHHLGADVLVDRQDPERAVDIIRGVTGGKLRYAVDIVGSETATLLERTLDDSVRDDGSRAHLLGLTGLPKVRKSGIVYHTVPIKLFHLSDVVGESMVGWLEALLETGALQLPEIVRREGGLGNVNESLEILRLGSVSGKRIVVDLEE
ncbi:oxidoreductase [Aspergillus heteromorphus CBS 117.55]|uniref:Oxidoreductase n=1 Tax=Aspergillus heteromorphus CBS 117.55 TaxID=1448321 RepID=A0A317WLM1_9EURO|nr:oxidoreductase [Aspergillus heteromorphus CBS 117.55]PWY87396.1 oxidoreductase [Aspergillus heteromorphus CBS 117.55]